MLRTLLLSTLLLGASLLAQWLDGGWLHQAIARHLTAPKEPVHG